MLWGLHLHQICKNWRVHHFLSEKNTFNSHIGTCATSNLCGENMRKTHIFWVGWVPQVEDWLPHCPCPKDMNKSYLGKPWRIQFEAPARLKDITLLHDITYIEIKRHVLPFAWNKVEYDPTDSVQGNRKYATKVSSGGTRYSQLRVFQRTTEE